MTQMKLRGFIIIGAIVSLAAGYYIGKTVDASSPVPGSSNDPVVSKSYVDKELESRVAVLETDIAELTVQAQSLVTTINELQTKLNASGTKTSTTVSTAPSTSAPKTTTPTPAVPGDTTTSTSSSSTTAASSSAIGKTAYVKAGNNYVNLRSDTDTTKDNVIKQVQKGEAMKIFEEKNSWYHVELEDKTVGWVASWVVDVK